MAVMEIVARVCSSLTCSCAQGVVECSRPQPHVRTLAILRGEQKGLYRLMVCARMQENRSEVVMAHPPLLLYSPLKLFLAPCGFSTATTVRYIEEDTLSVRDVTKKWFQEAETI